MNEKKYHEVELAPTGKRRIRFKGQLLLERNTTESDSVDCGKAAWTVKIYETVSNKRILYSEFSSPQTDERFSSVSVFGDDKGLFFHLEQFSPISDILGFACNQGEIRQISTDWTLMLRKILDELGAVEEID